MDKRTYKSVLGSKQFKTLIDAGLTLTSTDRQLANGTLQFTGKFKRGRQTIRPTYAVTAAGAVISNEFVARRVEAETLSKQYSQGLKAVGEILEKRLSV